MLRRKLAASKTVSNALENEHARNEAILTQLKDITSQQPTSNPSMRNGNLHFDFLNNAPSAKAFGMMNNNHAQQPLTTNTTFTLSQLPALRAILAEIRPKLAALRTTSLRMDSAKDERREERREYIEQRTKAHVQRNGQAFAENNVLPPGRDVDADEVEAMEKVAAMFEPS